MTVAGSLQIEPGAWEHLQTHQSLLMGTKQKFKEEKQRFLLPCGLLSQCFHSCRTTQMAFSSDDAIRRRCLQALSR